MVESTTSTTTRATTGVTQHNATAATITNPNIFLNKKQHSLP
jgi:hypothetical protein